MVRKSAFKRRRFKVENRLSKALLLKLVGNIRSISDEQAAAIKVNEKAFPAEKYKRKVPAEKNVRL